MSTIQTRLATLDLLPELLPKLLQNISISRGQIVVDQLRNWIDDGHAEGVKTVLASHVGNPGATEVDIAAAIVLLPTIDSRAEPATAPSDAATLLHAAWLSEKQRLPDTVRRDAVKAVRLKLDQTLANHGVRFVQWASDEDDFSETAEDTEIWRDGLGFEWAADLDYLTVDFDQIPAQAMVEDSNIEKLILRPTRWHNQSLVDEPAFVSVVEQTYVQTLDCPILLKYRTAAETLAAYQHATAFAPQAWFTLHKTGKADEQDPVGVLILALHASEREKLEVAELVYMGIVPAARGESLSQSLMRGVINTSMRLGANRLILAVDRQNTYARRVYDAFGMKCMLKETVAVKSLSRIAETLRAP